MTSDHTLSLFALALMSCAMLAPILCAAVAVGNEWITAEARDEAAEEWRPLVQASALVLAACALAVVMLACMWVSV